MQAVKSQTSLWQIVGKPPKGHTMVWSTEKEAKKLHNGSFLDVWRDDKP